MAPYRVPPVKDVHTVPELIVTGYAPVQLPFAGAGGTVGVVTHTLNVDVCPLVDVHEKTLI